MTTDFYDLTPGSTKTHSDIVWNKKNTEHVPKNMEPLLMELNGWCAPDYNYMPLLRNLKSFVNAPKGMALEQSYLYLDSASADDWLALASREDYVRSWSESLPLGVMASLICNYLEESSFAKDQINVLGLGCGDGKIEEALVRYLLREQSFRRISCQLFDINPLLAIQALTCFRGSFGISDNVVKFSHSIGNFLFLPQYQDLLEHDERNRLNVACLFGATFGNLQSELHFLRHSLSALNPGDLFLLDAGLTFAPIDDVEGIRTEDPRFRSTWDGAIEKWLKGPIERYRKNVQTISFENVLKIGISPFPGSYTVEVVATVNQEARFTLMQFHRYDLYGFTQKFEQEGWRPIGGETYGLNNKRLVYLFQKMF